MNQQLEELLDQLQTGQMSVDRAVKAVLDLKALKETPASSGSDEEVFAYGEPFLRDHTVNGRQVLPGVLHASLALNHCFATVPGVQDIRLDRLVFLEPIEIAAGRQVRLRVEMSSRELPADFKVVYRYTDSEVWRIAASGKLDTCEFEDEHDDPDRLRSSMTGLKDPNAIYQSPIIGFGGSFRSITEIYAGENEVLGRFELPRSVQEDHSYVLHPHILNTGYIALAPLLRAMQVKDGFLPFGINSVRFRRTNVPRRGWVYVRQSSNSGEMVMFNARIMSDSGSTLAHLVGASIKRIRLPKHDPAVLPSTSAIKPQSASDDLSLPLKKYLVRKLAALNQGRPINIKDNFMEMGLESSQLMNLTREIGDEAGIELNPTVFFEYPNTEELVRFLVLEHAGRVRQLLGSVAASAEITAAPKSSVANAEVRPSGRVAPARTPNRPIGDIAVIGMSGSFADAPTLDQYWQNLRECKDLVREIPLDHWDCRPWFDPSPESKDKTYCKWGTFIDHVDKFDAEFFKISPREAEWMDPQLKLLLQTVYAVGEDSGHITALRGTDTGVFVGVCSHDYADRIMELSLPVNPHIGTGLTLTAMANRVSFFFDLKGPSIAIDTACSSSLVALHAACSALRNGECGMAFVAGVNLLLSSFHYRYFSSIGALSATGRCHSFDASADGYVPGEGVGCVLLKPMDAAERDGDCIHAVIKGSAALHGGYTPSLTAPSVAGEENVILRAWEAAGVDPESISYIEAHGTGTKLGDPIEISALQKAFRRFTSRESFCAVGSAKASIGHTEGAAGIAGLLKVILQLRHREIPVMPQLRQLNSYIQLERSPLYINRTAGAWEHPEGRPRRAGISSFGFSGAYAHAVIEEYMHNEMGSSVLSSYSIDGPALIVLSARNQDRLREKVRQLLGFLEARRSAPPSLASVAYTLQIAREPMEERLALAAESLPDMRKKLEHWLEGREPLPEVYCGRIHLSDQDVTSAQRVNMEPPYTGLLQAWVAGIDVDWRQLWTAGNPALIALPTYPFAQKRSWLAELDRVAARTPVTNSPTPGPLSSGLPPANEKQMKISLRALTEEGSHSDAARHGNVAEAPNLVERPSKIRMEPGPGGVDYQRVAEELKASLAQILYLTPEEIGLEVKFVDLGLDSILGVEWLRVINKKYGVGLQGKDLYDNPTIRQLARLIAAGERGSAPEVASVLEPAPSSGAQDTNETNRADAVFSLAKTGGTSSCGGSDPAASSTDGIAILALSGRYPGAGNLDEFLKNLQSGKDCITEIPRERWNHDLYFDRDRTRIGKSYSKWGGFLDGVDEFDPLFFNISPREAEGMDPKIRLFLETVWNLFETAGYTRESLARRFDSKVGVFAGAMYHHLDGQGDAIGAALNALSSYSYIANRTSYFFNLRGPSIAIDTACSSSLVAVHLACESLRRGECRMALAGGVNLSTTPSKYLGLSLVQMIGSDPENCRTFGDGDGFFPSEGVGAVLLKPLSAALEDKDQILAIIQSSSVDHKGYTPEGFYAPDPAAQARLIRSNLEKAGVDPRSVSYVESAASGYSQGDAAEIEALTQVFREFTEDRQFCSIGSVKANIGHAEAASGISQLTKVVLQLQQKQIFPLPERGRLNPRIHLEESPFTIRRTLEAWDRPRAGRDGQNRELPLCATISSFGAGGANAHLVVQEYCPSPVERAPAFSHPSTEIILLSARNVGVVRRTAERLLDFVERNPAASLSDIAYTLQVGREAMAARVAMVVKTRDDLISGLRAYINSTKSPVPLYSHELPDNLAEAARALGQNDASPQELAQYWVRGGEVLWETLHKDKTVRRIPLPTYPFQKRRLRTAAPAVPAGAADITATQSQTRDSVKAIVCEVLRLEQEEISLSTPLDRYGVDSILFMRLVQQLQTRVDASFTVDLLQGCKTVQDIMNIVPVNVHPVAAEMPAPSVSAQNNARAAWPQFPELIHLNQSWEGTPVFWLHPALGGVEVYKALAQASSRPFYAIQARGWLTDRYPLQGVQAMVAYYAHIIQTVQPQGPYDLGGYSFGGVLAYELTRQLQELGQKVQTLVMLDSHDSTHTKLINLSSKSEVLQTVNTALAAMVSNEPENALKTLIHRDQVDVHVEDAEFLAQLVRIAKERGLPQSESRLQALISQSAKVQKAYQVQNFAVLPLPDPLGITCYYFRNKGGAFWGQLEPFNVITAEETPLDNTEYWSEWQANIPQLHMIDVDCHSHPTLLFESKTTDTIFEFCRELYSGHGMPRNFLASFTERAEAVHGVHACANAGGSRVDCNEEQLIISAGAD